MIDYDIKRYTGKFKFSTDSLFAMYCNNVAGKCAKYIESSGTLNHTDLIVAQRSCNQILDRVISDMIMEVDTNHYQLYCEYIQNPIFNSRLRDYIFIKSYLEPITKRMNLNINSKENLWLLMLYSRHIIVFPVS